MSFRDDEWRIAEGAAKMPPMFIFVTLLHSP